MRSLLCPVAILRAFSRKLLRPHPAPGLPLWEEAVVIVNPKYSTLRVPLSENVSGISRIGFGDDKNRIEYREARTRSSLIVQMLHEDGRIRQYVETVIRSDRSLTGDSYVLITDVAGEFLWCDRWKNGKRTDMALVGSSLPSSASADSQKLLLYGISLRSIWDTNELGEVGVPARPCPSCRHDPCTCCYRCGHDPGRLRRTDVRQISVRVLDLSALRQQVLRWKAVSGASG